MTAGHDLTHRQPSAVHVSSEREGAVESLSTRVLLDGTGRECHTCEGQIATGSRYKCLTLRGNDGSVSELSFCDEDCLDALADAGPLQ